MKSNKYCQHSSSAGINKKSNPELADIFRNNISKLPKISSEQWKVVNAVISCRTSKLGGHVLKCDHCNHTQHSYNSCRNRHCPKCQTLKKIKWLEDRNKELLPVEYFHVVFTIPDILNPIALQNKKVIYDILFKCVKETLLEAAMTPKNLGAHIGFISILHTWGQNLLDHPHIHCVIPGGGLSFSGNHWKPCKNKYFLPVKVLSKLFKGKFLDYIKKTYQERKLIFHGNLDELNSPVNFQKIIDKCYSKKWVVYSKNPFAGAKQVFDYLGRYTHRVAISNNRIISIQDGKVSFKWKDYKDNNKQKIMKVDVIEFMRRFLLHTLPGGFVRIRFYGFLSNKTKNRKINQIMQLLGKSKRRKNTDKKELWYELLFRTTGIDAAICSKCNKGRLISVEDILPTKDIYWNTS